MINLSEKIKNSLLWNEFRKYSKFEAYIWLLENAGKQSTQKTIIADNVVEYNFGEYVFQNKVLAHQFQWKEHDIKAFLKMLLTENLIKKTSTRRYAKIKLLELTANVSEPKREPIPQQVAEPTIGNIYITIKDLYMTYDEYEKLIHTGYTKEQIDKILNKLENYNKKKYKSIYLTCLNWLKREYPIIKNVVQPQPVGRNDDYVEVKSYLNRIIGKNLKGDEASETAFIQRAVEGYTVADFKKVINFLKTDKFCIEKRFAHVTMEYITRQNIVEKYSNVITDETQLKELYMHSEVSNAPQINKSIE